MQEDVVFIRVTDKKKGDIVFEGKILTDVSPDDLMHLRCFGSSNVIMTSQNIQLESFKGLATTELIATSAKRSYRSFFGVLYVGAEDGVLRKSEAPPSSACVMMVGWYLLAKDYEKMFQNETLEDLEIHDRDWLVQIPSDIARLKKLRILRLFECHSLKSIAEEIGQLSNLVELRIGECFLETLPRSLGQLKNLRKLSLVFFPKMKELPEEIGNLTNLKELFVSKCGLERLPKSMSAMTSLKSIDLRSLDFLRLCIPQDLNVFSRQKRLCVTDCDQLFTSDISLASFSHIVLSSNVNLSFFYIICKGSSQTTNLLSSALCENGSIVNGYASCFSGCHVVFNRNKANHARAMQCVLRVVAIKQLRRGLVDVPKEMVQIIAKMLWITRCDINAWTAKK